MTQYLIESDSVQLAWVEAESPLGAKRIHATRYGDDQELSVLEARESITMEHELEGNEQPFRALTENESGSILIYEKQVNQGGSKGIYSFVYDP